MWSHYSLDSLINCNLFQWLMKFCLPIKNPNAMRIDLQRFWIGVQKLWNQFECFKFLCKLNTTTYFLCKMLRIFINSIFLFEIFNTWVEVKSEDFSLKISHYFFIKFCLFIQAVEEHKYINYMKRGKTTIIQSPTTPLLYASVDRHVWLLIEIYSRLYLLPSHFWKN